MLKIQVQLYYHTAYHDQHHLLIFHVYITFVNSKIKVSKSNNKYLNLTLYMRFLKLIRNSKPKNTEDINTIEILRLTI